MKGSGINRFMLRFSTVLTLIFVCFCVVLSACDSPTSNAENSINESPTIHNTKALSHVISGPIMGTTYRVTVVDTSLSPSMIEDLATAIDDELHRINAIMSHYETKSELSRFNQLSSTDAQLISSELAEVIAISQKVHAQSGGAFDITLAPAINVWGFGPKGIIDRAPTDIELEKLRDRIGSNKLVLAEKTLAKRYPDLELNLSAVAKGYAVDKIAEFIEVRGMGNYLVDIGGEIRAKGTNAEERAWRVGVEIPHISGGVDTVISLANAGVATSGDYRNFIEIEGRRYSHTIDPLSLKPVLHRLASISVLHDSTAFADAYATAAMVLGEQKGLEMLDSLELDYLALVHTDADNYKRVVSQGFREIIQ